MKITTILAVTVLLMLGLVQTSTAQDSAATSIVSPQTTATAIPLPTTIAPVPAYSCNNNGICDKDMGETTANCEKDCYQATTLRGTCGDKICQATESKSSCSVDCGYPWVCGDGVCGGTETDWNCPQDCPQPTTPITPVVTPLQTTTISPTPIKCGVNTFKVCNECGLGVYKNVYIQCSDGSEGTLGSASSCKPADLWKQYATEACTNHCSSGGWGSWSDIASEPGVCAENSLPPTTIRPVEIPKATPVCYISSDLMQQYNQLLFELQKPESDKVRAEEITQQIIALKQQIATQQKECVSTSPQPAPIAVPWVTPTASPIAIENKPVAVSTDRCNEVTQWEAKINYYKKLSNLSDDDLKKEGFSREEIENIIRELSSGIGKVRTQCGNQSGTSAAPAETVTVTGSTSIAETVRPVVAESGQEITTYYKARLEKAVSAKGEEKQIEELKTLRDEIDGLISNLIKSRKEMEVSELNNLVKEVKVSRGEIKADDIVVKTTEKKMLFNVGTRSVSVEPTASQVLIRDKGLEVNADEVMIKENVLSVGGVDVKMSASEVTEKLGLTPTNIELKEENAKAVYNMKVEERRKLFGLIPFNSQKTISADAENGNTLSEKRPWYSFLTTK